MGSEWDRIIGKTQISAITINQKFHISLFLLESCNISPRMNQKDPVKQYNSAHNLRNSP